jgi:hypothetical protein
MADEDVKPAPVASSHASLPVNRQTAAGIAFVQTPRQNMEDVSDLTLDDSKPAAIITVHNNESKVPKREPSKTKHKGNDGMNAWWMGLAKGAKQKLFPLCQDEAGRLPVFESQHPAIASKYPTYNGICDQKSQHVLCWGSGTRGWQSKIY